MICSKCEWHERVLAGEFASASWSSTPCSRCTLTVDSTGALEYKEAIGEPGRPGDGKTPRDADADTAETSLPVSVLSDTLKLFLELPRDALDVIHMRYEGLPYAEIGEKLGITPAAVEVRQKRLMAKIPALQALFPGKTNKAEARRRRRGGGRRRAKV